MVNIKLEDSEKKQQKRITLDDELPEVYSDLTSDVDIEIENDGGLPLPPDGGWGWVVCFGSFVINFILDGTMFSFGVLLLDLLESFNETKSKTSVVGSALLGMSLMIGPLVSYMLEHFSIRVVTISGALIAASGFVISTFSPNIELLILTYGIIAGVGFCMMFIPALIVVGHYFNRKRAIATGIATSGSGLGTFAYAYLTDGLLSCYGWRGTVLILAGILLNCAACGALFRPLLVKRTSHKRKAFCHCETPSSTFSDVLFTHDDLRPDIAVSSLPTGLNNKEMFSKPDIIISVDSSYRRKYVSVMHLPTAKQENIAQGLLQPMLRKDIFYSGSIQRLPECKNETNMALAVATLISREDNSETSSSSFERKRRCCVISNKFKGYEKLVKNRKFLMLLVCMVMWTAQNITLTYLPAMARFNGIPRNQCSMLISIVGVTNILGRVLSGVVTDMFQIRSTCIYMVALFIASAANFILPFCTDFYLYAVTAAVFGLCMASAVSLRTIVLADHLGIDLLTKSFGVIALFQGIAFTMNAPIAGMLFDDTQNYVFPFVMAGSMYCLSAILCIPMLCEKNFDSSSTNDSSVPSSDVSLLDVTNEYEGDPE